MVAPNIDRIWISGVFILSPAHVHVLVLGILFSLSGHIFSSIKGDGNNIHFSGVAVGIKQENACKALQVPTTE